jgi:hypothetical protein
MRRGLESIGTRQGGVTEGYAKDRFMHTDRQRNESRHTHRLGFDFRHPPPLHHVHTPNFTCVSLRASSLQEALHPSPIHKINPTVPKINPTVCDSFYGPLFLFSKRAIKLVTTPLGQLTLQTDLILKTACFKFQTTSYNFFPPEVFMRRSYFNNS